MNLTNNVGTIHCGNCKATLAIYNVDALRMKKSLDTIEADLFVSTDQNQPILKGDNIRCRICGASYVSEIRKAWEEVCADREWDSETN